MFEIIGSDGSGRLVLKRTTLESAIKKAQELLDRKYIDVKIVSPIGGVILPDEFGDPRNDELGKRALRNVRMAGAGDNVSS